METQKQNGNEVSFDFQEEHFVYKMKESSGTQTSKIHYLAVGITTVDEFIERNDWFRNVWILWLLISIYDIAVAHKGSIWLILGIGMIVTYYLRTTRFSVLNSDEGKIFIIRNKQHDSILEKIRSEKRRMLREKCFFFDEENSPEQEVRKYQYLKDEGAITQEEFVEANTKLLEKNGMISAPA